MITTILLALYLTGIIWFMRNMSGIPLSEEDGIVYRWMWILGYFIYAILWPILVPILINRVRKELKQKKEEESD